MHHNDAKPEKIRWTLEVSVDRVWVEDGYYLTDEAVKKAMETSLKELFPGAYKNEVTTRLVKGPPEAVIRGMQKH